MSASGRVAYLVIPHLAVAVERREHPRLAEQPLVIASEHYPARVMDCSLEALAEGVRPGVSVRHAERLCPEAIFLPPRLSLYRQTAATATALLDSQLPAVEPAQPGAAYLDLSGIDQDVEAKRICRRQSALIADELRLEATVGVAANKFSAEIASLCLGLNRVLVLTSGTERSFLSRFPVAYLPITDETRRRLNLFGLRQLGQFACLPSRAVLQQFGWEGQLAHRLARGQDDRPVIPGHRERSEMAAWEFEPSIDNLQPLIAAATHLMGLLSDRLARVFLRAGQLDLQVTCVDGASLVSGRRLAEPTADAGRLTRLSETLLGGLSYHDPVSDLVLTLSNLTSPSVHQLSLWSNSQEMEADAHLARLAVRYGRHCFRRAVLVDPENRLAAKRFVLTEWPGSTGNE
ncbi:MAG: hypothetical protein U9R25_13645 [Chloroflexota bacterium]|nr:hypothetical protein [Chloroflexota bacterium]